MRAVPDFGINEDTANSQIELINQARITLANSRETLEHLAENQTEKMWTADGKSVNLMAALTAKYNSAVKWLDAIQLELDQAAVNLEKAILETTKLDDDQKASYQNLLYKTMGTGRGKPMAV